jgi:putative hydrolases of HD superfamily
MNTQALLDFVLTLDRLKAVERRTRPSGLERYENSAEHSWHGAMCAMLLAEECAFPVNAQHAALLLLMHDVPEIGCGDTFVYAPERADASVREALALEQLLATLPAHNAEGLKVLWKEFTANQTPEARYANALDRLMPLLHNLSHDGRTWHENSVRLEQVLARNGSLADVLPGIWAMLRPRIEDQFSGEMS